MPEWKFIAILHNLSLSTPIGNDYIAIVPEDDIRCMELLQSSPSLSRMVGNFTDQFGRRTSPSLLLAREGSPLGVSKQDAVIGFRNAIALSSITYAWQEALVRRLSLNVLKYSNYFDLYPITVSRDHDVLVIRSPSILGMDDPDDFIGQVSPELATSYRVSDAYDRELLGAIMALWADRFVSGRLNSWRTRVLFRSLEMAYHATTIPFENDSTIYDYGAKIALWVSAFEVLVRSETEYANLEKVLALLREPRFYWPKLRHRRYAIKIGKRKERVSLAEKLYKSLYVARNDFMHGNPVQVRNLFVNRSQRYQPLTVAAPLLYRQALQAFLRVPRLPEVSDYAISDFMNIRNFEDAFGALASERPTRIGARRTRRSPGRRMRSF